MEKTNGQQPEKELVVKILQAIYWKRCTDREEKALIEIITDHDLSSRDKAQSICDYLQIERRGNRSAIQAVIQATQLTK